MKYKYMHTLDGRPAHYYPGEQICYAIQPRPIPLCSSLKQIKKEQKLSAEWRVKKGFNPNNDYSHMKVKTP